MIRVWLAVAALLVAACASEADYREDVERWIGAREADLVASSWGPPNRVYEVIGGERILTYSKTSESGGGLAVLPAITIGSSGSGVSFSTTTGGAAAGSERYCETTVADWCAALGALTGVYAERSFPNEAAQPLPRCLFTVDAKAAGITRDQVVAALLEGDPAVAVATDMLGEPRLSSRAARDSSSRRAVPSWSMIERSSE